MHLSRLLLHTIHGKQDTHMHPKGPRVRLHSGVHPTSARKRPAPSRHKNYCFTINDTKNFDSWGYQEALSTILTQAVEAKKVDYCIFALEEAPQTGCHHLQGFIRRHHAASLLSTKALLGVPHAHLEPARGTVQQNIHYCQKVDHPSLPPNADSKTHVFGTVPPGQGSRADLKAVLSAVVSGTQGARAFAREHPALFVRYHRGVQALANTALSHTIPRQRPVNVEVHWGVTGAGKSHYAYNYEADFSRCYVLFSKGRAGTWFDNYDAYEHRTLLIEEFAPQDIPMSMMLRICHGWRSSFPVKGGSSFGNWENVIITSNFAPESWYPLAPNSAALLGRFSLVKEYVTPYVPLFIGPIQP